MISRWVEVCKAMNNEHVDLCFTVKEAVHYRGENLRSLDSLGPLSSVNLFVGATNTGKSRLMRALAKCPLYLLSKSPPVHGSMARLEELAGLLKEQSFRLRVQIDTSYPINSNKLPLPEFNKRLERVQQLQPAGVKLPSEQTFAINQSY